MSSDYEMYLRQVVESRTLFPYIRSRLVQLGTLQEAVCPRLIKHVDLVVAHRLVGFIDHPLEAAARRQLDGLAFGRRLCDQLRDVVEAVLSEMFWPLGELKPRGDFLALSKPGKT